MRGGAVVVPRECELAREPGRDDVGRAERRDQGGRGLGAVRDGAVDGAAERRDGDGVAVEVVDAVVDDQRFVGVQRAAARDDADGSAFDIQPVERARAGVELQRAAAALADRAAAAGLRITSDRAVDAQDAAGGDIPARAGRVDAAEPQMSGEGVCAGSVGGGDAVAVAADGIGEAAGGEGPAGTEEAQFLQTPVGGEHGHVGGERLGQDDDIAGRGVVAGGG